MPALRVVITGATGQLGIELIQLLEEEDYFEVIGLGRKDMDITDYDQVEKKMVELMPDIIIHTAAYTNVDSAEDDPDTAFLVNGTGTENLAIMASKLKAKLVYISTDYVFSGEINRPISESETPSPISVYGRSKLAGETYIRKNLEQFFIIRTSWVYGLHGNNFVKTMLELSEKRNQIMVVDDQIGSPTYTLDLAKCILLLMVTEKYGIYHVSNEGSCSWYEFAKAIFEEADIDMNVTPCETTEFPRKAPRPKYSVLMETALSANGFPKMRNWRDALAHFFEKFAQNSSDKNNHGKRLAEKN